MDEKKKRREEWEQQQPMDEKKKRRIEWAKQQKKIPSMKRRCDSHDYTKRGIYMITMVTEGRRPLFGTLKGNPMVTEGEDKPHIVLSPLGERVKDCWQSIPSHYAEVRVIKVCIMPDHIHGVLFVVKDMPRHLSTIVNGFKAGTRKAARELGIITAAMPPYTGQGRGQRAEQRATMPPYTRQGRGQRAEQTTEQTTEQRAEQRTEQKAAGVIWETGYNDRILLHEGQLQRMLDYLEDNPRRLLLKRAHPEYFRRLGKMTVAGIEMDAMGNPALLDSPTMLQVQCSRHLYDNEIEERKQYFLQAARHGAVIVSPCISPGEQAIATAILEARLPLVVLLVEGFPPFFKPRPIYLVACAEGRLLMLSPYPFQNEKIENMRSRCLELNEIVVQICQHSY